MYMFARHPLLPKRTLPATFPVGSSFDRFIFSFMSTFFPAAKYRYLARRQNQSFYVYVFNFTILSLVVTIQDVGSGVTNRSMNTVFFFQTNPTLCKRRFFLSRLEHRYMLLFAAYFYATSLYTS